MNHCQAVKGSAALDRAAALLFRNLEQLVVAVQLEDEERRIAAELIADFEIVSGRRDATDEVRARITGLVFDGHAAELFRLSRSAPRPVAAFVLSGAGWLARWLRVPDPSYLFTAETLFTGAAQLSGMALPPTPFA